MFLFTLESCSKSKKSIGLAYRFIIAIIINNTITIFLRSLVCGILGSFGIISVAHFQSMSRSMVITFSKAETYLAVL